MDFLGEPNTELRKMKGQVLALEALLFSVIETLEPAKREKLLSRFDLHAEKAKTKVLNSMATDELYEQLLEHLERYSASIKLIP